MKKHRGRWSACMDKRYVCVESISLTELDSQGIRQYNIWMNTLVINTRVFRASACWFRFVNWSHRLTESMGTYLNYTHVLAANPPLWRSWNPVDHALQNENWTLNTFNLFPLIPPWYPSQAHVVVFAKALPEWGNKTVHFRMEDLAAEECGWSLCVWQKIVGIEQLEPNGSQEGVGMGSKNGFKEENQAEAWDTEVGLAWGFVS